MRFEPVITVEMAVVQLQNDLGDLKKSNDELRVFITGNGDPKKGLLWLAANQGELLIALGGLITAQAQALARHTEEGHTPKVAPMGQWLVREGVRQVMVSAILVVFIILGIGIAAFVRNGGKF